MKNQHAFSLIELLVSLIIISLIVSVFAPAMSKKILGSRVKVLSTKKECSENCDICANGVCTKCKSGYGLKEGGLCEICQPGFYSSGTGLCSPCSAGKFASGSGAASCTSCPSGTYTSEAGSTSCADCPSGTFGVYNSSFGTSSCTPCAAGTFSKAKSGGCTTCPSGKYSLSGSAECDKCPPGYFEINSECFRKPLSQSDCGAAIFVQDFSTGNNICVTNRNLGVASLGASSSAISKIKSQDSSVKLASNQIDEFFGYHCWTGETSSGGTDSNFIPGVPGAYKVKSRPVCQAFAADLICNSFSTEVPRTQPGDWRLPTEAEFKSFANIPYVELCYNEARGSNSNFSKLKLGFCPYKSGACFSSGKIGESAGTATAPYTCGPACVWTKDGKNDGTINAFSLQPCGRVVNCVGTGTYTPLLAYSVRCVLDRIRG